MKFSLSFLPALAISVVVTRSDRLLPLALDDTYRFAATSLFSALVSVPFLRIRVCARYGRFILPLVLLMIMASLIDVLLGRFSVFSVVFWAKVGGLLIVGVSVVGLGLVGLRRVIIFCALLLAMQATIFVVAPGIFAEAGRAVGVQDPLTEFGIQRDRLYYAYFSENAAGNAILYMILAWSLFYLGTGRRFDLVFYSVYLVFSVLLVATGGRAVTFLLVALTLGLILASRRWSSLVVVMAAPSLLIGASVIASALRRILFLRQDSNEARVDAAAEYLVNILNQPWLGQGYDAVRARVVFEGEKPSHVFLLEMLAWYGIPLGLSVAFCLSVIMTKGLGKDARSAGILFIFFGSTLFINTVLVNDAFFSVLVPTLGLLALFGRQNVRGVVGR